MNLIHSSLRSLTSQGFKLALTRLQSGAYLLSGSGPELQSIKIKGSMDHVLWQLNDMLSSHYSLTR